MIKDSKILVTGGTGFFGRHLVSLLRQQGAEVHAAGCVRDGDVELELLNGGLTSAVFLKAKQSGRQYDYVFHLAGYNGGIQFNIDYPFDIFVENTMMGMRIVEECAYWGIKKLVSVVTSCAYPEYQLFRHGGGADESPRLNCPENEFFDGPIHDSVACHGYAKRNLQLATYYANKQHGLNAVCVCPTTLYGPGDSTDPNRTKVMMAMIMRFLKAKQGNSPYVECWGSGEPLREFLYVEDAARLTMLSLLNYDDSSIPLNLGSGQELSMKNLAETVAKAVEYSGEIRWDKSRPDGQYRKLLDTTRQERILGKHETTSLDVGIRKTIEWIKQENLV